MITLFLKHEIMNIAINCFDDYNSNYLKSLRIMGMPRNTSWLHRMAVKGKFHNVDEDDVMNFIEIMDSMINTLYGVHGTNWDIVPFWAEESEEGSQLELRVIILYPKFTITNSVDESQEIKDLIVEFSIVRTESGSYRPRFLRGTRATYSYPEYFKGYRHSHLTTFKLKNKSYSTVFETGSFCLGDNELNDLMSILEGDGYSQGVFELFLLTITSMVEWESLEGTPHKKIRNNVVGDASAGGNSLRMKDYFGVIKDWLSLDDVQYVLKDGIYIIKQNDKFEKAIKDVIVSRPALQSYWKYLLFTRDGRQLLGYSKPVIDSSETIYNRLKNTKGELPYVLIQGKKVELKVEPFEGELPSLDSYHVNPKLISYAAEQLQQELYKASVRKYTIERYNQSVNA